MRTGQPSAPHRQRRGVGLLAFPSKEQMQMTYAQEQAAKSLAEIWPEYRALMRSANPVDHRRASDVRDELWRQGRIDDWQALTSFTVLQGVR